MSKAFREYATRVSFNLSLSRNQIGHLAAVAACEKLRTDWHTRSTVKQIAVAEVGANGNMFIVGNRSLVAMGLIEMHPKWAEWEKARGNLPDNYARVSFGDCKFPMYRLTEAGRITIELLRVAGLVPKAIANDQWLKKAKVAS